MIFSWRNLNKLRIFFLVNFYSSYCRRMAAMKKGECLKCGTCCKGCPYQNEDHTCVLYQSGRPDWCRRGFPIDSLDLKMLKVDGTCGYYWEKTKLKCPMCDAPLRRQIRQTPTGRLELFVCADREKTGCLFAANSSEPRRRAG